MNDQTQTPEQQEIPRLVLWLDEQGAVQLGSTTEPFDVATTLMILELARMSVVSGYMREVVEAKQQHASRVVLARPSIVRPS